MGMNSDIVFCIKISFKIGSFFRKLSFLVSHIASFLTLPIGQELWGLLEDNWR